MDSEPKIYMSDEQFAWLKALEVSKGKEIFARVEEQTQILRDQESRKDEVLRDTFAINALIGIGTWMPMPDQGIPSLTTEASLRARAEWAYRQADAMIAARGGK
jgi:hypothetical protein